MEKRNGDPRMFLITCFLLLSIISGGILLRLYIFLPEEFSDSFYGVVGLVLISIPWIFWFFAYIYNYFARKSYNESQIHTGNSKHPTISVVASPQGTSPRAKTFTAITTGKTTECAEESSDSFSSNGRHVQFGEVTVLGSEENENIDDIENEKNAFYHQQR